MARQGGYICFLDESATRGMRACSWLCIAIICFERGDASVEHVGYTVYRRVTSLAGWRRGELKWRKVKRAVNARTNALEEIIRVIASGASHHNSIIIELTIWMRAWASTFCGGGSWRLSSRRRSGSSAG